MKLAPIAPRSAAAPQLSMPVMALLGAFTLVLGQPAGATEPDGHGARKAARADGDPGRVADRILAALVEANGIPGMAASVWKDGELVWAGEAGYRDTEQGLPVEEDTVFRLASVSKIFAAVAAARLREQGRLDVDRPVQASLDYLDNDWPAITARQLAAHTSGIPHYQQIDADRGGRQFATVEESVGVFSDRELLSAPGTRYSYSSYGYTLLSAVIERAAGKPYLDYLAAEIVPGLGIGPDPTGLAHAKASKAYTYQGGELVAAPPHDYSYSWGGAGLGATATNLARFGGRLLGGAVITRASFDWMLEPARLPDGSIVKDDDFPVGFGFRGGTDRDGERIAHHAGATLGARSVLLFYPDREIAVSVLSNAPWVSEIEQTAITLSAPFRGRADERASRPCPVSATRYEGSFGASPVSGSARFSLDDGVCVGTIDIDGEIAGWFNGPPQNDADSLEIIGLDAGRGLARAALITPFGAFDFRPEAAAFVAPFNSTRSLSVSFQ